MYFQLLLVILASLHGLNCKDLIVGDPTNKQLLHHQLLEYNAIPLVKRNKEYFFAEPYHRAIQAIVVKDMLNSAAEPRITAGGIGFEYVNFKFTSERGEGLEYDIALFGYA